jgi:hypothetical protein
MYRDATPKTALSLSHRSMNPPLLVLGVAMVVTSVVVAAVSYELAKTDCVVDQFTGDTASPAACHAFTEALGASLLLLPVSAAVVIGALLSKSGRPPGAPPPQADVPSVGEGPSG